MLRSGILPAARLQHVPKSNCSSLSDHGAEIALLSCHTTIHSLTPPFLFPTSSYWVNCDAAYKWYEVILVDPFHKAIRRDPRINWITRPTMKHRELQGKTAAGRHGRGLTRKSRGQQMIRPSIRANLRKKNQLVLKRYRSATDS